MSRLLCFWRRVFINELAEQFEQGVGGEGEHRDDREDASHDDHADALLLIRLWLGDAEGIHEELREYFKHLPGCFRGGAWGQFSRMRFHRD